MRRNYRYVWLLSAALAFGACDKYNYTDSLQGIGGRVEKLEALELKLNDQLEALNEIVAAIETAGYVTSVKSSPDGSYVITFNNGHTVTLRQGKDGQDGKDGEQQSLDISVGKDKEGHYYWIVNGKPLTDEEGNRIQAGAIDGKDGRDGVDGVDGVDGKNGQNGRNGADGRDGIDGKDGKDGRDGKSVAEQSLTIPQLRINSVTRHWEISYDNGASWTDTGTCADGKDGMDDLFIDVKIVDGGKAITFYLRDGRTFTVPIM